MFPNSALFCVTGRVHVCSVQVNQSTRVNLCTKYVCSAALCLSILLFYYYHNFRLFTFFSCSLCERCLECVVYAAHAPIFTCIFIFRALEESPQWLFVQGQDKQAKQLLILNGTAGYDEGLSSFFARNKRESEDAIEVLVATTEVCVSVFEL